MRLSQRPFQRHRTFVPRFTLGLFVAVLAGCQSQSPPPPPVSAVVVSEPDVSRQTALARELTRQAKEQIDRQDYDQAEDTLKRAVAADPLYGPVHNDLGLIAYHQGRLWEAAWEFQNAAKLLPNHAEPINNLGLTLERGGKLEEAEEQYAQAFTIDPTNPIYAGNQARARVRLYRFDEQTRQLLQFVIFHDTRPSWVDWARLTLTRIQPSSEN